MADNDLLTVKDVAGMWRVNERTVRRWAEWGWLKCYRVGNGTVRFRRSEVLGLYDRESMATPRARPEHY